MALTGGALTTATAGTLEAPSVVTTDVGATDRAGIGEDEWRFTVGGGLAVAPDYEGSDDYKLVPIPTAIAKKGNYRVRLFGLYVESNVLDHPNWRLGPSANYRSGYNNVENNDVQHLKNRGGSFELGVKGGYQYHIGTSTLGGYLQFLHDVSDGHDGYLISPSIEYAAPLAPSWSVVMQGNTTYASGDYMSHYFSVNQQESARTGIDTNNADADFKDVTFNVGFVYHITQSWNLSLLGQYKRLVGDAADCPVVDDEGDKNNFAGGFTVTYTW